MNPSKQSLKKEDFVFFVKYFCCLCNLFEISTLPQLSLQSKFGSLRCIFGHLAIFFFKSQSCGFFKKKKKEKGELRGTALAYL